MNLIVSEIIKKLREHRAALAGKYNVKTLEAVLEQMEREMGKTQ